MGWDADAASAFRQPDSTAAARVCAANGMVRPCSYLTEWRWEGTLRTPYPTNQCDRCHSGSSRQNSFHVVGLDQRGAIVLRQKWSRGQVERVSPTCMPVGMEACRHAHLSRKLQSLGHDAADAGEIRASLSERAEERFPRREGDRRGGTTPDGELLPPRQPAARLPGAALVRRTAGQPAHRYRRPDSCLPAGPRVAVRRGRFLRTELPRILATRSDVLRHGWCM